MGIGHSCGGGVSCSGNPAANDALMRWTPHDDGRGAQLNSDDRAALSALYAPAASGG